MGETYRRQPTTLTVTIAAKLGFVPKQRLEDLEMRFNEQAYRLAIFERDLAKYERLLSYCVSHYNPQSATGEQK